MDSIIIRYLQLVSQSKKFAQYFHSSWFRWLINLTDGSESSWKYDCFHSGQLCGSRAADLKLYLRPWDPKPSSAFFGIHLMVDQIHSKEGSAAQVIWELRSCGIWRSFRVSNHLCYTACSISRVSPLEELDNFSYLYFDCHWLKGYN